MRPVEGSTRELVTGQPVVHGIQELAQGHGVVWAREGGQGQPRCPGRRSREGQGGDVGSPDEARADVPCRGRSLRAGSTPGARECCRFRPGGWACRLSRGRAPGWCAGGAGRCSGGQASGASTPPSSAQVRGCSGQAPAERARGPVSRGAVGRRPAGRRGVDRRRRGGATVCGPGTPAGWRAQRRAPGGRPCSARSGGTARAGPRARPARGPAGLAGPCACRGERAESRQCNCSCVGHRRGPWRDRLVQGHLSIPRLGTRRGRRRRGPCVRHRRGRRSGSGDSRGQGIRRLRSKVRHSSPGQGGTNISGDGIRQTGRIRGRPGPGRWDRAHRRRRGAA